MSGIHGMFHVSILCNYDPDSSHVIQTDEVELDTALSYTEYQWLMHGVNNQLGRQRIR